MCLLIVEGRYLFSSLPFCPKFLTLRKFFTSPCCHIWATVLEKWSLSFLLPHQVVSRSTPLLHGCFWLCSSTARAGCVMGWVLTSDFDGLTCLNGFKLALLWIHLRGTFCGSAMRMVSKHHPCGSQLLRINAGSSEGMSKQQRELLIWMLLKNSAEQAR